MRVRNIVLIFTALVCVSCDHVQGKLKLAAGNFYFSRGMVNEAIGAYLNAAEDEKSAAYAGFALGSMYLALEQTDAALERFAFAEKNIPAGPEHIALLYRIRYNCGIAYFQRGDYAGAAGSFRGALEADNSKREAKRNFELSLISAFIKNQTFDINAGNSETVNIGHNDRSDIIFDYIRQKEKDRWQSFQWINDLESDNPDY